MIFPHKFCLVLDRNYKQILQLIVFYRYTANLFLEEEISNNNNGSQKITYT